jgi:hypothetical protein
MPAFLQTRVAQGSRPVVTPDCAGDVVFQRFYFDLAAALALGDIIELGILPAETTIVDAYLDSDDLDTNGAPAIKLDVGLMSGTPGVIDGARTVGTELFAADTTAQAGGVTRMSKQTGFRIATATTDRSIGVKVNTAPATGATTGRIAVGVWMIQP